MTIRDEVREFYRLGPLPSEQDDSVSDETFEELERMLHAIEAPVTDEEARLLLGSFGEDNCFGMAWTLLHLVESAPSPAVTSQPPEGSNMWIENLWIRYRNALGD
ncbi:hypothetical protein ACIBAI_12010 [Streptomyces sp. NPDC051041]|uniref:hypothetical protein n=1 Tax=Streptomyces sp. NPDC051041 TaxID=3365640 RepID=UPI00378859D4